LKGCFHLLRSGGAVVVGCCKERSEKEPLVVSEKKEHLWTERTTVFIFFYKEK
jgi:hypothetical protein